jgi:putative NADH-flavin reductase
VVGDPRKIDELSAALPGHDAVISALGNPARGDERLVSEAASATLTAMSALNIKRYVCVSGALLFPSVNPAIILLRTLMAGKLADARRMEQLVTASTSEWTIVRPPRLKSGDQSLGYRTRLGGRPSESWASLQFIDLAALLLDVVEQQQFVREIVGVGPA